MSKAASTVRDGTPKGGGIALVRDERERRGAGKNERGQGSLERAPGSPAPLERGSLAPPHAPALVPPAQVALAPAHSALLPLRPPIQAARSALQPPEREHERQREDEHEREHGELAARGALGLPLPPPGGDAGPRLQRSSLPELIAAISGKDREAEGGLLVDDDAQTLTRGQLRKGDFMRRLRREVRRVAEEELRRAGRSARDCPYIDRMLGYYEDKSAEQLERSVRRYAPETRAMRDAREYVPALAARLARGIARWASTGQMPEDVPDEAMAALIGTRNGIIGAISALAGLRPRRKSTALDQNPGRVDGGALLRQLGPGVPLASAAQARMEHALGHSFAAVRVHDDPRAAELSRELSARAFTLGPHIAFGAGELRPGTPEGDALLAHELAHVVQQGTAVPHGEIPLGAEGDPLEHEADRVAAAAVGRLHFPPPQQRSPLRGRTGARDMLARLSSAPRLQRCSSSSRRDQRAGTRLPDATTRDAMLGEMGMLPPVAGGTGAAAAWDGIAEPGRISDAEATHNRDVLRTTLVSALEAHLAARHHDIDALRTRDTERVGLEPFLGGAQAAKVVVDGTYNEWAAPANIALTSLQAQARNDFAFQITGGAAGGQNLFDAASTAALADLGINLTPEFRVKKLLQESHADLAGARSAMATHHFEVDRTQQEIDWLRTDVQEPLAAAHGEELNILSRLGYARTLPGRAVLIQTDLPGGVAAATGEQPSDGERRERWHNFQVCAHEYIHMLEHPAFARAVGRHNAPKEMFTTFFTRAALQPILPGRVPRNVRRMVEGGDFGEDTAAIGHYTTPQSYVGFETRANHLRDSLAARSSPQGAHNAMRGAYFQGHVELIGLGPTGAPGPTGESGRFNLPAGFASWQQLCAGLNASPPDVVRQNPGVAFDGNPPVPGTALTIAGVREHLVVMARGAAGSTAVESKEQIAHMNGVSVEQLERANPGLTAAAWTSLSEGQRVLIPIH